MYNSRAVEVQVQFARDIPRQISLLYLDILPFPMFILF